MPRRRTIFADYQFYHIYNRSVGGSAVFNTKYTSRRAIELINFYRFTQSLSFSKFKKYSRDIQQEILNKLRPESPLVEIFAFALMPNHFHFLLRQLLPQGTTLFTSNFQNGFAKYFNTKNNRHGAVFCNPFKAVRIESEEQLLHVSRYVHLNPVTSYMIEFEELAGYGNTSFGDYADGRKNSFISKELFLNHFREPGSYQKFVFNQVDYQRKLREIKHLILE